ncbi:MAG TPA: AAA family ATPase [Pirellulales bacterium]|nr:AAA family ATPase [Pirellulales bacterium]
MMPADDPVAALREALRVSPTNLPLHQHLVDSLVRFGRYTEAEAAYRDALVVAPRHQRLKLGLAEVFFQQEKDSQSLVIVEDLLRGDDLSAQAYLLHSRLLLRLGEPERAARQYREALALDPALADAELAGRLEISPSTASCGDIDTEEHGCLRLANGAPGEPLAVDFERPAMNFADVGGMEAIKEEIRLKIIHPLEHADLYLAYGKPVGGGILMYGPPGCGKTHLARATAGEAQADFLTVSIHDVLDMYLGNSEKRLHTIFEHARRNQPCVLFFDEVDAIGASRSDMRHSAGRHLINQFLAELDGIAASNEGVLILAATNAPWHLDAALRRPGRFDRVMFVPPPDMGAREAILRVLLAGKPVEAMDYALVARRTADFSGADLKALVDVAIEEKLRTAIKTGLSPLHTGDLTTAAIRLKPTTKEWFATARNYALYSNQGGQYDDILRYLNLKP